MNMVEKMMKDKHLIRVDTPCFTVSGTVSVTVEANESTTAGDVKKKVLKRFKPGFVDPNLFAMSVLVESENTHSVFVLRDDEEIMRFYHWHQHTGPVTYSLDANEPMKLRIYTGKVFQHHVYKTLLIAEQSTSLEVLRILLHSKKRLSPENYVLIAKNLRDGEYSIRHSERIGPYCGGQWEVHLKKLKQLNVSWDDTQLTSFIDYESADEGMEEEGSEKGSSMSSDSSSVLESFTWVSDSVLV